MGVRVPSAHGLLGRTKCLAPVAADGKPSSRRRGQRCAAAFEQHAITQQLAPHVLAEWHAWATSGSKPFSVLRRPSKAATALYRKAITISGACRSGDTRCGRCCITSIVVLRMARHQRSRFFRQTFPDLFETVLAHIEVLPRPRQREDEVALSH